MQACASTLSQQIQSNRGQQANDSLGKTAVVRYTCPAETPTRQVGFRLPLALWILVDRKGQSTLGSKETI